MITHVSQLLSPFENLTGVDAALLVALFVVGALLVAATLFAFITRIIVWSTYSKYNKIMNSENLTAKEAAEKFRDLVGISQVSVQQCSWWRALFSLGGALGFGNNYSIYKKTIFLRKNIIDKASITAVGVATQKVGLALQDKEGSKLYRFTARVKPFVLFAPAAFIPLVLIGVLVDVATIGSVGITAIITTLAGAAYFILSFLVILFTIKVEKKANATALKLMEENNFLNETERGYIKEIYNAYILAYIADFIIALLEVIKMILKLLLKVSKNRK